MTEQLQEWQGDFGKAYTDRNAVDYKVRMPAWRKMVEGISLARVLEVGSNRAHNLAALREILGPETELFGIEPNAYAVGVARKNYPDVTVMGGNAFDLPFKDGFFDLTFTAGVLIHIAPADLPKAMSEIVRVSRRYVLAAEYFSEREECIEYRGHSNLLWKRNFEQLYRSHAPSLKVVKNGYWSADDGFDRTHWWLLDKGA